MAPPQFEGFVREDGAVGTRNRIAVIASVICSTTPVQEIAATVESATAVVHVYGCAQVGDDHKQTRRTLVGIASNPNVGAVLVVGLGCENNQAHDMAAAVAAAKPIEVIGIQQLGGSDKVAQVGREICERFESRIRSEARRPVDASKLRVGILPLDEAPEPNVAAYAAVGNAVDRLVDLGAHVTIGVNKMLAPAGTALAARATGEQAAERLRRWGGSLERRVWDSGHRVARREWTAAERAAAELAAPVTGTAPIVGAVECAHVSGGPGLHLMGLPANPVEAMSALVAGGVNVLLVVSRKAVLSGAVACPTLVAAPSRANGAAASAVCDLTLGAGDPLEEAEGLVELLFETAGGRETRLEALDLYDFAVSQVGTPF